MNFRGRENYFKFFKILQGESRAYGFNNDDVPVGASHVGYYMGFNEFSVHSLNDRN